MAVPISTNLSAFTVSVCNGHFDLLLVFAIAILIYCKCLQWPF